MENEVVDAPMQSIFQQVYWVMCSTTSVISTWIW